MKTARPSLRERKKDATRQAIEKAAWELFAERGYDETSVNDIAERAMVAPRTFFRYYPSKEAVLYPEFDEMLDRARATFSARPPGEPLITSLLHAMEATGPCLCPTGADAVRSDVLQCAAPDSAGEYAHRRITEMVHELVAAREPDRADNDARGRVAACIVMLVVDIARETWAQEGAPPSLVEIGQHCFDVFTDLTSSRPTPS